MSALSHTNWGVDDGDEIEEGNDAEDEVDGQDYYITATDARVDLGGSVNSSSGRNVDEL